MTGRSHPFAAATGFIFSGSVIHSAMDQRRECLRHTFPNSRSLRRNSITSRSRGRVLPAKLSTYLLATRGIQRHDLPSVRAHRLAIWSGDGLPARKARAIWLKSRERRMEKYKWRSNAPTSLTLLEQICALLRSGAHATNCQLFTFPWGIPGEALIEPEGPTLAGLKHATAAHMIAGNSLKSRSRRAEEGSLSPLRLPRLQQRLQAVMSGSPLLNTAGRSAAARAQDPSPEVHGS